MTTEQKTTTTGNVWLLDRGPVDPQVAGRPAWEGDEIYVLGKGASAETMRLRRIWTSPATSSPAKPGRVVLELWSAYPGPTGLARGEVYVDAVRADAAQIEDVTGLDVSPIFGVAPQAP
jgi:hypothetical protein